MKPLQTQPPYTSAISEPKTGLLTVNWIQWFQTFFFVDPLFQRVVSKAVAYTLLSADEILIVDTSGGGVTIKLPASFGDVWLSKTLQSKRYTIKASGASAVTVNGNGHNIDGAGTANIAGNTSKSFVNNGTQWYAIN